MVQVTQTNEEVNIIIELNRLMTRKPDVVLLPFYLKFNNPPIFFERHLTHEIDEVASFCRIFKNEARLVLIKKEKSIWPEIFQKLSKEELMLKRLQISDQIVERNKERDKTAIERYEHKRRTEIEKEVRRETAMRDRVTQLQQKTCREAIMIGARKDAIIKPKIDAGSNTSGASGRQDTPMAGVRNNSKISVCFSNFSLRTPKRESQLGLSQPFKIEDNTYTQSDDSNIEPLKEYISHKNVSDNKNQ